MACSLPFVTHHPSPITLQSRSRGQKVQVKVRVRGRRGSSASESASARQKGIACSLPFVTHHPSLCRVGVGVGVGGQMQKNQGVDHSLPFVSLCHPSHITHHFPGPFRPEHRRRGRTEHSFFLLKLRLKLKLLSPITHHASLFAIRINNNLASPHFSATSLCKYDRNLSIKCVF